MTSTSTSPSASNHAFSLVRLWPILATAGTILAWVSFIWSQPIWLSLIISMLLALGLTTASQGHRLLLVFVSSILIIYASWLALYAWPIPNLVIIAALLILLAASWQAMMASQLHRRDLIVLLFVVLITWLAVTYLPSSPLNATTLTALPLFVLLPPVYHRLFRPSWLLAGFALSLAGAILIIQTAVLYS